MRGCICRSRVSGFGVHAGELPAVPEVPKFSAKYQERAPQRGPALQCRPRHHRADGPGAWAVCAPVVVVAQPGSIHAKEKHFEPIRDDEHAGRNAGFRMAAHAPSSNSLPYKLLGADGPVTTTIDFVLPNRRYETIRCGRQMVGQPDHGDAGDAVDLPHRRVRGVERAGVVSALHAAAEVLRRRSLSARTRRRWWSRRRGCAMGRR